MKVFEQGGHKQNYWVRLFSFDRDENERALLSFECSTDGIPTFCVRVQVGGDCFAEVALHVFKKSFSVTVWSV